VSYCIYSKSSTIAVDPNTTCANGTGGLGGTGAGVNNNGAVGQVGGFLFVP
jgi:hypothetical protein